MPTELHIKTEKFRSELLKIMPGYKWTVHKPFFKTSETIEATGIKTAGFNRISTLRVIRRENKNAIDYEVKSSGYGVGSQWISVCSNSTLASALRDLQNHYERMANKYSGALHHLQTARAKK